MIRQKSRPIYVIFFSFSVRPLDRDTRCAIVEKSRRTDFLDISKRRVCVLATHLSMTTEKRSATTVFFWLVLHDAAEWTRFLSLFLAAAVLKAIACCCSGNYYYRFWTLPPEKKGIQMYKAMRDALW